MDPVSLTLAILPLVAGAVKAYGKLHKKLKCFCHYSREVYRARKQFDRQRQFFHNEVHLLIRPAVEDESAVELMLSDPSHATWASRELEDALKRHLGPNYNACLDVIEEISSSNKELLELMTCFSEVESRRRKVSAYSSIPI
jgi:hypothetical protein